ncbi:MAG TPA: thioredoxin domain-containing protein [Candidatus Binatia bacterium]|nr:thioredoxin domain-containing protein [Candidatus Binatia bacterium]
MNDLTTPGIRAIAIAALATAMACHSSPAPEGKQEGPPAAAAGSSSVDADTVTASVKRYFHANGQLGANVDLSVSDLKPSEVGTLTEGTLHVTSGEGSQAIPFFVSRDGRWLFQGKPVDLTADPRHEIMAKIDVGADQPSRGAAYPKVTIVEYGDFQCPFSAKAEAVLRNDVLPRYGQDVRVVYKSFPMGNIHPWAESAALMGLCVLKQNGNDVYWKFHDAVFAKARDITADEAIPKLLELVKDAGADPDKVEECYDDDEMEPLLDATVEEAEQLGVVATPTFFVNGRRLLGPQSIESFGDLIDPEVKKESRG